MAREEEAGVGEVPSAAVATSERARKENSSNKRDTARPSPRVYRGGPVQATLSAPSMAEGPLSAPRALCDGGGQLGTANLDRESCMLMILVHDEEDLFRPSGEIPQGGSNEPSISVIGLRHFH